MIDKVADNNVNVVDAEPLFQDKTTVGRPAVRNYRFIVHHRGKNRDNILFFAEDQMMVLEALRRVVTKEFERMEDRTVVRLLDEILPFFMVFFRVLMDFHSLF
jgi:hypothetical protein